MGFCSKCGVELDENMEFCPLCGTPSGISESNSVITPNEEPQNAFLKQFMPLSSKQKIRLTWELISLLLLSGIIVTFLIDFFHDEYITWSLYPIVCLVATWIYVSLFSFCLKRPVLFLGGFLINTIMLLLAIDAFDKKLTWFLPVGLPIAVAFIANISIFLLFLNLTKKRGLNLWAILLLIIALFCICVELIIKVNLHYTLNLTWSAIVFTSVLPVCIFLFFIHYRLGKNIDLKKIFHL